MALFIGRIPRSMSTRDIEGVFNNYGKIVRLDIKTDFGFVEFENKEDAEKAIEKENGKDLVVEWAKNGGKRPNENECFNCGQEGHWAKDCRERSRGGNGGGRSRRDMGRDRRDRYDDRRDHRRDDRRDDRREDRRDDRRGGDRFDDRRDDRREDRDDRDDRRERRRDYERRDRPAHKEDRERSPAPRERVERM